LALGAGAAQIGTAFLACEESNAAPLHRQMLFSDAARRTSLTRAFSGRLARSIHNEFIERMQGREAQFAPYPVQAWLTGRLREAALRAGRADVISLWAGQGAAQLRHRSARKLFAALASGAQFSSAPPP
jgi:nitronate monooxygenase